MKMTSTLARFAGALALLTGLTACAKGPDKTPLEVELVQNIRQVLQARRAARGEKPARPALTRAALDATVKGAFIEVTIEESDVFAYLSRQASKHDDFSGTVEVWRSEDNVNLAMRDGVLVATRGMPNDLLAASALVHAGGPKGPSGSGERIYEIAALDNESYKLSLVCQVEDLGPKQIEIVELTYRTRHLRETCEGRGYQVGSEKRSRVVNDYWIDSRTGRIWQSRQWAGPELGYLRIRQLTSG